MPGLAFWYSYKREWANLLPQSDQAAEPVIDSADFKHLSDAPGNREHRTTRYTSYKTSVTWKPLRHGSTSRTEASGRAKCPRASNGPVGRAFLWSPPADGAKVEGPSKESGQGKALEEARAVQRPVPQPPSPYDILGGHRPPGPRV